MNLSVTEAQLRNSCVTEEKTRKPAPVLNCNYVTEQNPLETTEIILTEEDLQGVAL